jgi:CDP-diacylglycerol--glycerol-3-phosphate 3-phosphatidyltransferase
MRREFLTPSNLLSISRAVLVVPFVAVMLSSLPSARVWGGVIMIVGALTDKFDGLLARKYGYETEWGRILDPLADKIGIAAIALVLLWLGDVPLWFVIALLTRDLLIFFGGIYIKVRKGAVLQSNMAGKWAVGIIALTLFLLVIVGPSLPATIFLWISVGFLIVSFALYLSRFAHELQTLRQA